MVTSISILHTAVLATLSFRIRLNFRISHVSLVQSDMTRNCENYYAAHDVIATRQTQPRIDPC